MRSALCDYLSVNTNSSTTAATPAISQTVKYKIPRQVDSSALGTSAHRQTKGSQRWLGPLSPPCSAAHPARLFAAPDHNNGSCSRRLLESLARTMKSDFSAQENCFVLPSSQPKMRSGRNLKLKNLIRIGNRLVPCMTCICAFLFALLVKIAHSGLRYE